MHSNLNHVETVVLIAQVVPLRQVKVLQVKVFIVIETLFLPKTFQNFNAQPTQETAQLTVISAGQFEQQLFKSNLLEVFLVKGILKICSKFIGEQSYRSVISIKLQSNFIENTFWHFLGTPLGGCF